ncbi:MAG: YceD family protein, partial [Clostridium sp.]|nr:YceD family protein [Clostridium sp.]
GMGGDNAPVAVIEGVINAIKEYSDIEERFTTNSESEDEEAVVVIDDVLDITELVETSIISTLPIKRVCKDDCKGLCQKCGCNLNVKACDCNKEDVDIRFEVLRGLFDNKEV